jgi:hypothetical protein
MAAFELSSRSDYNTPSINSPYRLEFVERVIDAVDKNKLIGEREDLREWCPFKFGAINDKDLELATLSWGYFLGVLLAYRDSFLSLSFRGNVDRATEYYRLAAGSPYEQVIRDCVRSAIPEIRDAFTELKRYYGIGQPIKKSQRNLS